eukprot:SAG31_NODE_2203_length_6199_cov_6.619836_4_plen_98_part_00
MVISPSSECEFSIRWVYGVPSDPQKQARNRVINRVFGEAIKALGGAKELHRDKTLQNATRFALKLGEHTDGRDVKSNLKDNCEPNSLAYESSFVPRA